MDAKLKKRLLNEWFGGAFLTKRACQQHIENNKHHYREPHTYAMTAYRNYELERLLKILKTIKL